jgi:CheY-like chemotaxis protein
VLHALYDPSVLRSSSLVELFDLQQRSNTVSALQHTLTDAIEALRPNERTPGESRTWRVYQILRRRYTEQVPQRRVAADLGLSVRQLQREEKAARELLADYLWSLHGLEAKVLHLARSDEAREQADAQAPTRAQELASLKDAVSPQMADIAEVVTGVQRTVHPLLQAARVSAEWVVQEDLPPMPLHVPIVRQALLNIVTTAARHVSGGEVHVEVQVLSQQICIKVRAVVACAAYSLETLTCGESLQMAHQLLQLCRGSLEVASGQGTQAQPDQTGREVLVARMTLPIEQQVTVLVIDDNADVLRLFQRYLSGTRYRLVSAQDVQRARTLVEEWSPEIIVIDIMMPDVDGWTLLGQLREHPRTSNTPIIVCTILPQEDLAFTLGAVEFIRKPVRREELLSALDRQLERSAKGSCGQTPGT